MAWAENHYSLIVWKLASMERAFPSIFGGRWLTPDRDSRRRLGEFPENLEKKEDLIVHTQPKQVFASRRLKLSGCEQKNHNTLRMIYVYTLCS